jgi:ABC-type transport system involved in multi-copper enzyme maturation permease subunit
MSRVAAAFWNPIVAKEYRSRMRTWRSPLAMMVYVVLIAGLGYAMFSSMARSNSGFAGSVPNYGLTLFKYLVVFQMVLITLVTPALTAGAISSERERQTIDLLFVTRIPPFSIIWGKLLASMSFVVLLLLLSVPIFSLVFLFGGIELDQVLYSFLVTIVAALAIGLIGIAFSTWLRRTLAATVASYMAAFLLVFGTVAFGMIFPTKIDPKSTSAPAPPAVTYLSPIVPLVAIADNGQPLVPYLIRYDYPNGILAIQASGGPICKPVGNGSTVCSSSSGLIGPIATATGTAIPSGPFAKWQYWQATVFLQLAIGLFALLVSAFLLPPVRRWPWWRPHPAAVTP